MFLKSCLFEAFLHLWWHQQKSKVKYNIKILRLKKSYKSPTILQVIWVSATNTTSIYIQHSACSNLNLNFCNFHLNSADISISLSVYMKTENVNLQLPEKIFFKGVLCGILLLLYILDIISNWFPTDSISLQQATSFARKIIVEQKKFRVGYPEFLD